MTIARTGNKIVDAAARRGATEAKREAARSKAAAKKSARSASRKSAVSKARAGRAATSRGGRGIAAHHHKSGKGFRGLIDYAMDKPESRLLMSNCGIDKASIIRDMRQTANLRPACKKPVGHLTLSLPPSTKIDDQMWLEIIAAARKDIGLHDSYSFATIRHSDSDHDHVHFVFCKVSDSGEVFNDYMLGPRLAATEQMIEERFNLPLIPTMKRDPVLSHINKQELEKSLREGVRPPRLDLSTIVKQAAMNRPTVIQFIQRCSEVGVVVRPNLASTGKLNGFSFSKDGIEFKGSKLGASWGQLQQLGVNYEQSRDHETLAELAETIKAGVISIEPAEPAIDATPHRSEQQMEGALGQTNESTKGRTDSVANPKGTERKSDFVAVRSNAFERLVALRHSLDVRRIKYDAIRKKLKDDPFSKSFAEALNPTKSETEVAQVFLRQHAASAAARNMINELNLTHEEMTNLLSPWNHSIKAESAYESRMSEAFRHTAAQQSNELGSSSLPTM